MITSGLQLAIVGGALVGLGIALLIWRLVPAEPDLADVLDRLSPAHAQRRKDLTPTSVDTKDQLGIWAIKHLPASTWGRTPTKELALLRIPTQRFYGEKVLYAVVGLFTPPLLTTFILLLGLSLPLFIPVLATLGFAVFMFFIPDIDARSDAKKARAEFARA
ncbi:MAG: hypothetical protein L0H41_17260, partial [Microlunatus sp.]|nr:hypothetical protein [Microlunatus sp.]